MQLEELEEGDRVLFNDRRQPLEVVEAGEGKALVEGPQGGEYVIFKAEDSGVLLVSKPGNREYASKVEDLRRVGKWERTGEGAWVHDVTGSRVEVVENDAGNWTLEVEGVEEPELPGYGFLEREDAVEEAEKLVRDNPEG
ncbi:MAG: hypothetical protein SVQ76_02015 [Candidatus Nanohaloarchaea archaeon]|nr:hypothetical protein [Candidatus Nanohaloarchaea archaeon]